MSNYEVLIMLKDKIVSLMDEAGFTCSACDLVMDLELAMTEDQRLDLSAMIDCLRNNTPASQVASNVMHDLHGLRQVYLNGDDGFSPRSSGYANHLDRV